MKRKNGASAPFTREEIPPPSAPPPRRPTPERRGSSCARGRDHGFLTITVVKILAGKSLGINPRGPVLRVRPRDRSLRTGPRRGGRNGTEPSRRAGALDGRRERLSAERSDPIRIPGRSGPGLDELANHPPHDLRGRHVLTSAQSFENRFLSWVDEDGQTGHTLLGHGGILDGSIDYHYINI